MMTTTKIRAFFVKITKMITKSDKFSSIRKNYNENDDYERLTHTRADSTF